MNKKVVLSALGLVIILLPISYYYLGGFNDPNFEVLDRCELRVVGKEYQGEDGTTELRELFSSMRSLAKSETYLGDLTIISMDKEADPDNRVVSYFVGVELLEEPSRSSSKEKLQDLDLRKYSADNCVRVDISAHILVMPSPDKVKMKASKLGQAEGFSLAGLSFDQYPGENQLIVTFPTTDVSYTSVPAVSAN